ncbi:MAG: hypothetical protein ACHP84_02645 [Caulobacterales bacterium]
MFVSFSARPCSRTSFSRPWIAAFVAVFAAVALVGHTSAAAFVGTELTDVKASDRVTVAHPQPVQVIFQFQTKGAPNAAATKFVRQQVIDTVKQSGLFSEVSDAPVPNGAIISITVNDVASAKDMQDAEGKGFATGLTLGIAGSNIADHYICTVDYVADPTSPKVTKTAQQSIIIQMGLVNSTPKDAVKVDGGTKGAVFTMIRQIVSNPLNALAADPGFQPVAAAATPPSPPAPSPPAAPSSPPQAGPAATPPTPATPVAPTVASSPAAHP